MKSYFREVERIIERHWSDWSLAQGRKHLVLTLRRGPHTRQIYLPTTPSDGRRGTKNFEAQVRRTVRELRELS